MYNLDILFFPIDKITTFEEIRKILILQINNNSINSERWDSLLKEIEYYFSNTVDILTWKDFYIFLSEEIPELSRLKEVFDMKYDEKYENFLALLIENVMDSFWIEETEKIMLIVENEESITEGVNKLQAMYPLQFEKSLIQMIT